MSSSKGNSNSNKTAHVMNLLRKSNPSAPAQSEASDQPVSAASAASAAPATPAPPPPAPQTPPIITALNADAEVSSQIRAALTEALEEEERAAAQASAQAEHHPVPTPEPKPAASPEPAPTEVSAPITQAPPAPEAAAPATKIEVSTAPAQPASDTAQQLPPEESNHADDSVLINTVQELTNDKADKYIRLFGLCSCKRCRNDVLAIALNHLPPQYVVMSRSEFQLRYDMYSNRYDGEITSQLLRACQEVMDHPRH